MNKISPLPANRLHAVCDPTSLPWQSSDQIPSSSKYKGRSPFQPRVMKALDMALQINEPGYNIYLSGETYLGRIDTLLAYLKPAAGKKLTPSDLVYVRNFSKPDFPRLLVFPAGMASKFRKKMEELIENLRKELEKKLKNTIFAAKKSDLLTKFQKRRSLIIESMKKSAREEGFILELDELGALAIRAGNNGKKTGHHEFSHLPVSEKEKLSSISRELSKKLHGFSIELNRNEEEFHSAEEWLEKLAMKETLDSIFTPYTKKLKNNFAVEGLDTYFDDLKNDILENVTFFIPAELPSSQEETRMNESFFDRYAINLFVENSPTSGAPIIIEDNPTYSNLLGCLERESEMGALVTDFSLVRAGSLQKANGGFLILRVEDILQKPLAWEGLLRALASGKARIEDSLEVSDSAIRTKGLAPDPVDLNLKVILVGSEDYYEELLENDEQFAKLFRMKAHMTDQAERTTANIRHYLVQIAQMARESSLAVFDASALAWLVDLGSHLCEDQKRLSLKFPLLKNLMIEADALARLKKKQKINNEILEEAWSERSYRSNLLEDIFMEDYDRAMIRLETSGNAIGQVNGLSVTMNGDYEFGLPHKISCTVGVGHDGIIDLEREADLGGPIHTKAMMILKSYLAGQFARKKPLVLTASLYFEQSYAGIEGDSASGAELAALLSALAEVPARLDLAFTGAVSHSGQIMAVGGVTRKIEGFYKVCKRKGLTGSQGVIIPWDNMDHLMLAPEILASVNEKKFFIYPIRTIDEALFLLTGMKTGKRRKNGTFTPGSLFELVDNRLENLGFAAQNAFRRQKGKGD